MHTDAQMESAAGAGMRRRQRIALTVAVVCAVVSTGGLIASTLVKSPEQARAEAAAPPASTLTAVVERRVLATTVVTRGTVTAARTVEVTPVAAGAEAQVVTAVAVRPGEQVKSGQVLLAVSGRPLIALPGDLPAYRDLKPGDTGPDVGQLQQALAALGHYRTADKDGYFGTATKAAIRSLYTKTGYDIPDTGGPGGTADKPALTAARDAVDAAEQELESLKRRIAAGEQPGPAEGSWDKQLDRAGTQVTRAKHGLADLIARTGPKMPLAEFVFVPGFPATVASMKAVIGGNVSAPLITLAAGELAVVVKARPQQAAILRDGMPAQIVSETLGQQIDAVVTKVGDLVTPADGTTAAYHPVTLQASKPVPPAAAGLDVRVTITSAKTAQPVLVVPLSAVSAGADGRATVSKLDTSGAVVRVEVKAGASGDGFVEIIVVAGTLTEGDRVVVSSAP